MLAASVCTGVWTSFLKCVATDWWLPIVTVASLLIEGLTESWSIVGCKGPVGTAVSCMAVWLQ